MKGEWGTKEGREREGAGEGEREKVREKEQKARESRKRERERSPSGSCFSRVERLGCCPDWLIPFCWCPGPRVWPGARLSKGCSAPPGNIKGFVYLQAAGPPVPSYNGDFFRWLLIPLSH